MFYFDQQNNHQQLIEGSYFNHLNSQDNPKQNGDAFLDDVKVNPDLVSEQKRVDNSLGGHVEPQHQLEQSQIFDRGSSNIKFETVGTN